jgi:putative nucleotidyltransferase with HDIG domain
MTTIGASRAKARPADAAASMARPRYHGLMISFSPPAAVEPLLARVLAIAGSAGVQAYVVGGSVRDVMLGRAMRDLDLGVDRDAFAFARRLADELSGHFVELDDVNAVARVVLDGDSVDYIDIAQLQGATEDDLRRRDFTIDALAVALGGGIVLDVTGGVADLAAGCVRMTGEHVFADDPLRMLRAPRIASELGFTIDLATADAIRRSAPAVSTSAAERRRDELARIFALDRAGEALRLLDTLGLLDVLLPEVTAGRGVTQPESHHVHDVLEHGIAAVEAMDAMLAARRRDADNAWMWATVWRTFAWRADALRAYVDEEMSGGRSRGALMKLAALLHDVAKPQTRTVGADGRIRFLGHADEGARMASTIMHRYRFSSGEIVFVTLLVREHLRPVQLAQLGAVPSQKALYRFERDLGDAVDGVLLLSLADAAGSRGPRMTPDGWSRQAAYMNSLLVRLQGEDGIVRAPRLLTGHDIMSEFGIGEGPAVGRLLEALREAQAVAGVRDREAALAFVRSQLDETGEA